MSVDPEPYPGAVGRHRGLVGVAPPARHASLGPRRREAVIGTGVRWTSTWVLRWLVIALGAFLLGWAVEHFWSILLPVVLATILSTVLERPTRLLERRLRVPRALASLSTILLGLLAIGAAVVALAPSIGAQALELADSASAGLTQVESWLTGSGVGLTEFQVASVVDAVQDRLRSSAAGIASGVVVGVGALTSALVTAVLTVVLVFLFLKDGDRFLPWVGRAAGPRVGGHLGAVGARAWDALGTFVRTQALVGLIDAVLIGSGLLALGVPLAAPLAALTFVAAFAPIVGAVAVGALAVLVALVAQGPGTALAVLVVVLVVQQVEGNVLLPWLQGRSLRLHAGVVLLTIVLGSTVFGVAGAFLSVPVVAVGAVVLRYLDEQVERHTRDDADDADDSDDSARVHSLA